MYSEKVMLCFYWFMEFCGLCLVCFVLDLGVDPSRMFGLWSSLLRYSFEFCLVVFVNESYFNHGTLAMCLASLPGDRAT